MCEDYSISSLSNSNKKELLECVIHHTKSVFYDMLCYEFNISITELEDIITEIASETEKITIKEPTLSKSSQFTEYRKVVSCLDIDQYDSCMKKWFNFTIDSMDIKITFIDLINSYQRIDNNWGILHVRFKRKNIQFWTKEESFRYIVNNQQKNEKNTFEEIYGCGRKKDTNTLELNINSDYYTEVRNKFNRR